MTITKQMIRFPFSDFLLCHVCGQRLGGFKRLQLPGKGEEVILVMVRRHKCNVRGWLVRTAVSEVTACVVRCFIPNMIYTVISVSINISLHTCFTL